jgi:CheY-like chemotaxis protein
LVYQIRVRKSDLFLLVEDDENTAILFRFSLDKCKLENPVQVVENGDKAIAYLQGAGGYGDREKFPFPSVILLDLKMPGLDGFTVLEWIRKQPDPTGSLRVIVLTGSEDIRDVNKAYQMGANSFLVKPVDFSDLHRLTDAINGAWVWMQNAPEGFRPGEQIKGHGAGQY